jgi:16S rRNA (cytosine967-C5)-methyltransferase
VTRPKDPSPSGDPQDRRGRPRPGRTQPGRPRPERSRTRPAERTRRAEPTRAAAYHLLRAVADGAYANLELPRLLVRSRLAGRDAAFTTELAFGTLRHRSFYDAVIAVAADRPTSAVDERVLDVLRLGAHQLLGMRVPDHAAVDQTVGLARAVVSQGAGGFVNAVLRRVSEADRDQWLARVVPAGGGVEGLAVEHSHPPWVVAALRAALIGHGVADADTVETALTDLLCVDNESPLVSLVARPGLATVAELVAAADAEASTISPIGAVLRSGDPAAIDAVSEGRAAVQDEGSQLLALALAAAPVGATVPERWLDLCAGPGGKSGVLAALAAQRGVPFVATEVSEHRAELVRRTLRALPGAEVRTADGRAVGEGEPAAYSRILVDAPCTGLGALRRRPEARWRRQPSDLAALGPLQRDLLRSALDAVAPGGLVGYATCSPHLAETTFVVRDVLRGRADVDLVDARPLLRGADGEPLPALGEGPMVQLWPHVHGTDGMFFALLRRR